MASDFLYETKRLNFSIQLWIFQYSRFSRKIVVLWWWSGFASHAPPLKNFLLIPTLVNLEVFLATNACQTVNSEFYSIHKSQIRVSRLIIICWLIFYLWLIPRSKFSWEILRSKFSRFFSNSSSRIIFKGTISCKKVDIPRHQHAAAIQWGQR